MTEDNQNNEFKPQPLPGQVFIRPGIDDRPDYEKTLTPEAKAAMRRLTVKQHPRVPEASNERPETQVARIAAEGGAPLTAAAHLDAAVPNLESSFLDLRDPMTAPDGTKPIKSQANRLTAGFALGSMLFNVPLAALNTVLMPQFVCRLTAVDGTSGLTPANGLNSSCNLALLTIAGFVLTFVMNAVIAVASDHSYCRFGRRTPWIIGGSVLTAAAVAIMATAEIFHWPCSSGCSRRLAMRWSPYRSPPRSANAFPTNSATAPIRGVVKGRRSAKWSASSLPWLSHGTSTASTGASAPHARPSWTVHGASSLRPSSHCWSCRSNRPAAICPAEA